MATIGSLAVRITADSSGLTRGLNDASREISTFRGRFDGLIAGLSKFGPIAVAAGAAIGAKFAKDVINAGDALAKLSQRTGISVEDLSRLQYAANLSGVSASTLTTSLGILSRNMAEAATGSGDAAEAFAAIGVSVKNADGSLRSQNAVLQDVAERFASYEDGAAKSALAMKIFGRGAGELIPLLNAGSDGLRAMGKESDQLGNTLSGKIAKESENFNDNLTKIETAAKAAGRALVGDLLPSLVTITSRFVDASKAAEGFFKGLSIWASIPGGFESDPFAGIASVEASLARLKKMRDELDPKNSLANRINDFVFGDVADLDKQIAVQETRLNYLKLLAERMIDSYGFQGSPLKVNPPSGGGAGGASGTDDFARRQSELDGLIAKSLAMVEQAEMESMQALDRLVFERLGAAYVRDQEEIQQTKAKLASKVQLLQDSLLTEGDLERTRHAKRLEDLQLAFEAEVITREQQLAMIEALELQHQERLTQITDAETKKREDIEQRTQNQINAMRAAAVSNAAGLLQMLGSKSKAAALAAIALNRGLMIAQVVQNTAAAQTRALAELGPIAGPAAAAKIGAFGKLQAGIIAATGLAEAAGAGGGSSAGVTSIAPSGASTGGANVTGATGQAPPQIANINVTGESFSRGQVVSLIQTINELSQDGVRLVIQ